MPIPRRAESVSDRSSQQLRSQRTRRTVSSLLLPEERAWRDFPSVGVLNPPREGDPARAPLVVERPGLAGGRIDQHRAVADRRHHEPARGEQGRRVDLKSRRIRHALLLSHSPARDRPQRLPGVQFGRSQASRQTFRDGRRAVTPGIVSPRSNEQNDRRQEPDISPAALVWVNLNLQTSFDRLPDTTHS
jgi:hypothetical protein